MSDFVGPVICGLVFICAVFLVCIVVAVLLYVNHSRSRRNVAIQPSWRTVTGQVVAASVEETARTQVDDDTFYYPQVEFQYVVEGHVYTGRQAVGRPYNVAFKANQTLARYPVGSDVTVYYDPEGPGEARLVG